MKLTITTAALLGALLLPTLAFADTRIVNGCEVATVPGTNYSNQVDPACVMTTSTKGLGLSATATLAALIDALDD